MGEDLAQLNDRQGRAHYVRLISWLEGEMLVDATPHDEPLLASLGATMAEIDRALHGLSHPAMNRELHWNIRRADLALVHLPLLAADQQRAVRGAMQGWLEH